MAKRMTLSAIMEMVQKLLQDLPVTIRSDTELAARFAGHRNAVRQIYEGLKARGTDGAQIAAELSTDDWKQLASLISPFTCGLIGAFSNCTPDVMADVRYSCARSIADIAYFSTCNQMANSIISTGIVDSGAANTYVSTLQCSLGAPYKLVKATTYELIRALASLNASSNAQQAKALNDTGVLDVMIEVVSCANGENVDRESRLLAGKVIYGCLSRSAAEPGCEVKQLPVTTVAAIKRHIKDILDRVPSPATLSSSTKPLTMPASMPTTLAWIWLLPKPVLDELFDVRSSSLVVLVNRVLENVWPEGALSAPVAADPRPNRNTSGSKNVPAPRTMESTALIRSVAGKWLSNLTVRQAIVSLLATLESGMADVRLECVLRGVCLPPGDLRNEDGSRQGGADCSSHDNLSCEPCHQGALPSRLFRFLAAGSLDNDSAISVLELLDTMFSSSLTAGLVQDALAAGLVQSLSGLDTEAPMQTDVGLAGLSAYIRFIGTLVKRANSSPELSTQLRNSGVPLQVVKLALDPRTRRGIRIQALRVLADKARLDVAMVEIVTAFPDFCPAMHKLLITGGNVSGQKQARSSPAVEVKETAATILTSVLSASMKSDKVWQIIYIIAPMDIIPQLIQHFQTTTLPAEVLVEALEAVRQGLEQHQKDSALVFRHLAAACAPQLLPLLVTGQPAVRDAAAQLLSVVLEMNGHGQQATSDGVLEGTLTSSLMAAGVENSTADAVARGPAAAGSSNAVAAASAAAHPSQQLEDATARGLDLICRAIQSQVAAIIPQPPTLGVASHVMLMAAPSIIHWPDVAARQQLMGILRDCTVLCDSALKCPASEPSPLRSQLAVALVPAKAPLEQLVSALDAAGQQAQPLQPVDETLPLLAAARRLLAALAEIPVLDAAQMPAAEQTPTVLNDVPAALEPSPAPTGSPPPRRRGRPPGSGKRQRTKLAADLQLPAKQLRQETSPEDVDMSQPSEAIEELPVPRCGRRNGKRRSAETAGEQHVQTCRTQPCDEPPAEPTEWLGVLEEATLEADANTAEGAWSLLELRGGVRGLPNERHDAPMQLGPTCSTFTSPLEQRLAGYTPLPLVVFTHHDGGPDESPGLGTQSHAGALDGGGSGSGWASPSVMPSDDGDTPDEDGRLLRLTIPKLTVTTAAVTTMGCAAATSQPVGGTADDDVGRSGGGGGSSGQVLASVARLRSICTELKAQLAARDGEVAALEAKVAQLQAEKSALRALPPVAKLVTAEMQGASREVPIVAMEAADDEGTAATAGLTTGSGPGGDGGGPAPLAQRIRRQVMEYKEQVAKAASELEAERQAVAQLRVEREALKAEVAENRESHALEVQRIQHESKQLALTLEAQMDIRLVAEAERDRLLAEIQVLRSSHAGQVRQLSEEKARKEDCLQQADVARKAAEAEVARQNAEIVRLRQELQASRQEAVTVQAARDAALHAAQQQAAEAAALRQELGAKSQELELVHRELILTNELI